ncbi:MAG: sigma 54-interacting transcriptional regulator, partial [Clostridiales bacterium]
MEKQMNHLIAENKNLKIQLEKYNEENKIHLLKEANYEDILYNMRDTVERENPQHQLTYVNKAYCEFYGVNEKKVIGTSAMNCVYEADRKKIEAMMKRVTPAKPNYRYSCRVRKSSGEIVWVETEGRCFFDKEGNILEFQEVGRDISQHQSLAEQAERFRLSMEEKVRERTLELINANAALTIANSYLQNTINNISEGIITIDSNGNVKFLNYGANAGWSSNEKYIKEKLQNDLANKHSITYKLIHKKENFQNNELIFPTSNKEIQCLTSGVHLNTTDGISLAMLILQPLSDVRHLVNSMSGAHARFTFKDIIGKSNIMRDTVNFAKKIAPGEGIVVIEGESGTGKELFAQSIHNASPRKRGPFIAVNCGAIPRDLIGSELFGYAEGSFTGAKKGGKPGKFEMASGGTIFLDEIGEMPIEQQITLLRVLQERVLIRIGGERIIPINVRIICATNKNLLEEVQKGNFRQDLYYRLNVINIHIPPLRERLEDITELFCHFIEKQDKNGNYQNPKDFASIIEILKKYSWPGNVRELQNITERTFYIANSEPLDSSFLPDNILEETQAHNKDSVASFD